MPDEVNLGRLGGHAWIEDGSFHFKRGHLGGKLDIAIPLNTIQTVHVASPTSVTEYISAVTVTGTDRVLAYIPNLHPMHGNLLAGFLKSHLPSANAHV